MTNALPTELGLPMVYLVDDEAVVRDAVAWLLRSRRILSTGYPGGEAFLADLPPQAGDDWPASPSCVLLDIRMGGMSGLALFEELARRGLLDALPVIFLTGHGDVPTAVTAVKRGAFDFVEKPFSNNALVDRVELALAASARTLSARRERAVRLRRLALLNERERAVMQLVAEGLPNKQIADRLHLSVRTIEVYRAQVFDKLEVASAVALANLLNRDVP
jgi:two-component system response regulator DctR